MFSPDAEVVREIALLCGFEVDSPYCTLEEQALGIREINNKPIGEPLTALQRLVLMENVRRIITITASSEQAVPSVRAQSTLRRWHFLRDASPIATEALIEVLRYFQIEVPESLREGGQ